ERADAASVAEHLRGHHARAWQVELTAGRLAEALRRTTTTV
ncbi:hypothetical protein ACFQZ2_20370, partial [Streptomonospora algeriensis]